MRHTRQKKDIFGHITSFARLLMCLQENNFSYIRNLKTNYPHNLILLIVSKIFFKTSYFYRKKKKRKQNKYTIFLIVDYDRFNFFINNIFFAKRKNSDGEENIVLWSYNISEWIRKDRCCGYELVIISKRPSFGSLLGLSNDRDETDKIFVLLFVPIFTSVVQIISSSILKESIWLLHVTGRPFVFDFFLIAEMIAARVWSNSSEC